MSMAFKNLPFIKFTILFFTIATVVYVYGFFKIDVIHNSEAIKEIIPYIYAAMILGSISIISFIIAIFQLIVKNKNSNEKVL